MYWWWQNQKKVIGVQPFFDVKLFTFISNID